MKFLLLNDNPVVNKLVTLSAQKTGDELMAVSGVDEVGEERYDLLIVDNAVYNEDVIDRLKQKISYKRSLLMAPRGFDVPIGFDKVISKPFLPTDLVEFFTQQRAIDEEDIFDEVPVAGAGFEQEPQEHIDAKAFEPHIVLNAVNDLKKILREEVSENDELLLNLDEMISSSDNEDYELDEIILDTDEDEDEADLEFSEFDVKSILDEDEILEVKELLDEAEEDQLILDTLEEEGVGLNESTIDEVTEALADLDYDLLADEQVDDGFDEEVDIDTELESLEEQIASAVSDLSEEELDLDVDKEMLLDLVNNSDEEREDTPENDELELSPEFDEFDTLDAHDLKIAVDETDDEDDILQEFNADDAYMPFIHDESRVEESDAGVAKEMQIRSEEGLEALQALTKALKKAVKDPAAAKVFQGMKVNINITFGEQN